MCTAFSALQSQKPAQLIVSTDFTAHRDRAIACLIGRPPLSYLSTQLITARNAVSLATSDNRFDVS